ncbi:MAG: DUF2335 domain-containing protein [Opitutaceae bacterium]|nr:DUF2335 domain-containing protein [Opitutaceae bacterium]
MANQGLPVEQHGQASPIRNGGKNKPFITASAQTYSGPTPPPDHIEAYQRWVPDAAERFMRIAESEIEHRRLLEVRHMKEMELTGEVNRKQSGRGQWMAFVLGVIGIGGSIWLGVMGQVWPSTVIGGGSLTAIIVAFLRGSSTPPQPKR